LAALIDPLTVNQGTRSSSATMPVRAFGQDCVTKSLSFVSHDAYRESLACTRNHFTPRKNPGAWLSLVKIQLFPLPNCQRTTWQNPRGIHDKPNNEQSFRGDCHELG